MVTGGEFKRRVLYTTDTERTYPIDYSPDVAGELRQRNRRCTRSALPKIDMGNPGGDGEEMARDFM